MKPRLTMPPMPPKLQGPDAETERQLKLAVTTPKGRELAHQYADTLERLIERLDNNRGVWGDTLRLVREALGEVEG
jgi:hypothetical protein